jgi:hypothetical protein
MATKTPAQKSNEIITLFIKKWETKYGKKPTLNRYKWKWAMQDMISDLGWEDAVAVVDYFFRTDSPGHNIEKLAYNYEEFHKIRMELDERDRQAVILREQTRKRVEAFEQRRTEGNQLRTEDR